MLKNRIKNMLLLVAIGDALGMPVEIWTMEKIKKVFGLINKYYPAKDDHPFFPGRAAGRWTDDWLFTSSIMRSMIKMLVAKRVCINMDDIAQNDLILYKNGLQDFGAGKTTRDALRNLSEGVHWSESGMHLGNNKGGGNGISMKVSPVAAYMMILFLQDISLDELFDWEISKDEGVTIANLAMMTHRSELGVASGFAQIYALIYCLKATPENFSKDGFVDFVCKGIKVVRDRKYYDNPYVKKNPAVDLLNKIESLKYMNLRDMSYENIVCLSQRGSCYVIDSLMLTYMMFLKNPSDIETLYRVVSAGGDTDSNGAQVGPLLGALNEDLVIPENLISGLYQSDEILKEIDDFCGSLEVAFGKY